MAKIIRTKTEAKGGITAEEKARMDEHAKLWISRAMRTDPIEPDKIIPAIEGLYAVAGLKNPVSLKQSAGAPHKEQTVEPGEYFITNNVEYNPFLEQARRVAD